MKPFLFRQQHSRASAPKKILLNDYRYKVELIKFKNNKAKLAMMPLIKLLYLLD